MKDRALRRRNTKNKIRKVFNELKQYELDWFLDESRMSGLAQLHPDLWDFELKDRDEYWYKHQDEVVEEARKTASYRADNMKACNCKRYDESSPKYKMNIDRKYRNAFWEEDVEDFYESLEE